MRYPISGMFRQLIAVASESSSLKSSYHDLSTNLKVDEMNESPCQLPNSLTADLVTPNIKVLNFMQVFCYSKRAFYSDTIPC